MNFLVLRWMKATISPPLCLLIQKESFALQAWKILESTLSPESKQYMQILKNQIPTLKKTSSMGMTDHLIQMKSLSNSLHVASKSVSESNLVSFIINGLGMEFNNFLHNLHFQSDLTFDKIFGILIQEESLLKHLNPGQTMESAIATPTTLVTTRGFGRFHGSSIRSNQNGDPARMTKSRSSDLPPLLSTSSTSSSNKVVAC